ncbi:MAG: DUF1840 domain-containing protein [Gammaproteobacteria bacterium]
MLITFKTRSYANITLFGDVAKNILEMMDFGVVVPGAIVAKDVARALENLQSGLESVADIAPPEIDNDDDQPEPVVSLHTRAIPLIELLQSAVRDDNDVRWE